MPLTTKLFRRWDSSDPERAPPPLPPNPNPSAPAVRSNTSSVVAAAAQALADKARDAAAPAPYTTNPMPDRPSERSLIKGAAHRRLQSLQTGTVRDMRALLDGGRPDRSPERPIPSPTPSSTRGLDREYYGSPEKSPSKSPSRSRDTTPTPTPRDCMRDTTPTPSRRGSRAPAKSILGENTPPSATMLALQTLSARESSDTPLANVTNGARPTQSDALSSSIHSLTTIATNLQQEMKHLSQRSKDNASDLNKLKEATNARDEDIRKSLRELITTISAINSSVGSTGSIAGFNASKPTSGIGQASTPPPPTSKTFTLPRISSPASFVDERIGSPNPYSVEGAASVAMLEKILREMVTKEGQERLVSTLNEHFDKASEEHGATAKMVSDLVGFIKDGAANRALVRSNGANGAPSTSGPLTLASRDVQPGGPRAGRAPPADGPGAAEFVNGEVAGLLKKIKDSVFHSGGLISEVKAQQRDLRGEVLHMGRTIAQKIDATRTPAGGTRVIEDGSGKQDVARIVTEGLAELRAFLETAMREKRRQSSGSSASRATVDSGEVYDVVRHALAERGLDRADAAQVGRQPVVDKEAILEAVKEAYEAYRPEIELQQFGLERDEILQCLKEGLEDYRGATSEPAVSRAEILDTIQQAMQSFTPPRPINESAELRDEVLGAVRECLDELRPGLVAHQHARDRDLDATREVVHDAVAAALARAGPNAAREIEINEEDLLRALTRALESSRNPLGNFGDEMQRMLQAIVAELHKQFQQYSAANGRDTDQVLDFVKDSLESHRVEIEGYVDRAQDVTGKDEIVDEIRAGVAHLRDELEKSIAMGPDGERAFIREQFDQIQAAIGRIEEGGAVSNNGTLQRTILDGFEQLRSEGRGRGLSNGDASMEQLHDVFLMRSSAHKDEILDAVQGGFDVIQAKLASGSFADIKEELEHLRNVLSTSMVRQGGANDDTMDEIRACFNTLGSQLMGEEYNSSRSLLSTIQSEFDSMRERLGSESMADLLLSLQQAVDNIKQAASSSPAEAIQALHMDVAKLLAQVRDSSKADTDEILDAVRIGLDDLRSHLDKKIDNPDRQMSAQGEILDTINDGIENLKTDLTEALKQPLDMTVCYDILETLKEGLKGLRSDFEGLKGTRSTRSRSIINDAGNAIILAEESDDHKSTAMQQKQAGSLQRDDIQKMEVMLAALQVKVEAMDANITDIPSQAGSTAPGTAMKTDLNSIENLLKDMQASVDVVASQQGDQEAARKEDADAIETLVRNAKAKLDEVEPASLTTSEQLDAAVEKLQGILADFGEEMKENSATKKDVFTVEALVLDLKTALDELKDRQKVQAADVEDGTRLELEALRLVALEVKEKVLELQLFGTESQPTKEDLSQLTGLLHDFRDSHDKLKDSYECDIAVTGKAFDDRRQEAADIMAAICSVKGYVDDLKDDLGARMGATGADLVRLSENVNGMEQTIGENFSIAPVVRDLVEKVDREFERVAGLFGDMQRAQEEHLAAADRRRDDLRDALVAEISARVDEHSDALVEKLDEARIDSLAQGAEQGKVLAAAKEVSEELKISIDTLGTAVTAMETSFRDLSEQAAAESRAAAARVEEGLSRVRDVHTAAHADEAHAQTRVEVAKAAAAVDALAADVGEYHPRFMVALEEVRAMLDAHRSDAARGREAQEGRAREMEESSRAAITNEIREAISSNLPALLPPPPPRPVAALEATPPAVEKYDDAEVHAKLDKLIASLAQGREAAERAERMDRVQAQVLATAAELREFVAAQQQQQRLLTDAPPPQPAAAREPEIDLSAQHAEKGRLESELADLRAERLAEQRALAALRADRERLQAELARQRADAAALGAALSVRADELRDMDARAEAVERRLRGMLVEQAGALVRARAAAGAAVVAAAAAASSPSARAQRQRGLVPRESLAARRRAGDEAAGAGRRRAGRAARGGRRAARRRGGEGRAQDPEPEPDLAQHAHRQRRRERPARVQGRGGGGRGRAGRVARRAQAQPLGAQPGRRAQGQLGRGGGGARSRRGGARRRACDCGRRGRGRGQGEQRHAAGPLLGRGRGERDGSAVGEPAEQHGAIKSFALRSDGRVRRVDGVRRSTALLPRTAPQRRGRQARERR